jgi:hypothetical protein
MNRFLQHTLDPKFLNLTEQYQQLIALFLFSQREIDINPGCTALADYPRLPLSYIVLDRFA